MRKPSLSWCGGHGRDRGLVAWVLTLIICFCRNDRMRMSVQAFSPSSTTTRTDIGTGTDIGTVTSSRRLEHGGPHTKKTLPQKQAIVPGLRMASGSSSREDEIRKKIALLKRKGKISSGGSGSGSGSGSSASSKTDYDDKLLAKLGKSKLKLASVKLGRTIVDTTTTSTTSDDGNKKGSDGVETEDENDNNNDNDTNVNVGGSGTEEDEEQKLVELVALKLAEMENMETTTTTTTTSGSPQPSSTESPTSTTASSSSTPKTTSGVGGTWNKAKAEEEGEKEADYVPARGSWGAFPRPRDISAAYGGGRQIGKGVQGDGTNAMSSQAVEATRERLKEYRRKFGIEDVESEKVHRDEIREALELASRAMSRGIYDTAVSALEKVTVHCSTNSRTGSKVFLELGMAYEAAGRTDEAVKIFVNLSRKCRIDQVRTDAKRLLYNREALDFVRKNNLGVNNNDGTGGGINFNARAATSEFIDVTGLANFADNFDSRYRYATTYVADANIGYYKRLTENVVRSPREARQVLLRACAPGGIVDENASSSSSNNKKTGRDRGVTRLRIVQALGLYQRKFDGAMAEERRRKARPVILMDGVPLNRNDDDDDDDDEIDNDIFREDYDTYRLSSPRRMSQRLNGEWKLCLLADKKGDAVRSFVSDNETTNSNSNNNDNNNEIGPWQLLDLTSRRYSSSCGNTGGGRQSNGPDVLADFLFGGGNDTNNNNDVQEGDLTFDDNRRVLKRVDDSTDTASDTDTSPWSLLFDMASGLGLGMSGGSNVAAAEAALAVPQQILLVDSFLCVTSQYLYADNSDDNNNNNNDTTSYKSSRRKRDKESNVRDFYCVWTRVTEDNASGETA